MTLETFFEKFELFADAPDAVAKMRGLVLHLAVTGKLVDQDPCDESGELLLKKISAERLAAVKARQISPMKPLLGVGEDELLFELKPGWTAVRLIELVMEIQTGPFGSSLHKGDYQLGGTPVINPASLKDGKIVPIGEMAIGPTTLTRLEVFKLCAGDIVMARRGEMGRCSIVSKNEEGWLCGTGSLVLRMPRSMHAPYLAMLIGAPMARSYLGGVSVGTTMQNLNQTILAKMPMGVPPLAEQKRIVAKVDELMVLCDRLEAQQREREETAGQLARASLARFAEAPTPASLAFLFHSSFTIPPADLRKAILTLAVQGKLVPPDPNDEPAEQLLTRIAQKRTVLLKAAYPNRDEASTQLRKQEAQALPDGLETLPLGWAWGTLIQASLLIVDCHNKTAPYVQSGTRLLRTTNIRDGRLNLTEPKFVDEATYERWSARCKPESGDVLITREAPMGEVCIIPKDMKVCLGQRMMLVRLVPGTMDTKYILYSLMAPDLMERVQDKPVGATVQHLRVGGVETLLTPIPPLAEQRRIVARVDQLMALVDQLEAQLAASRAAAAQLLEAAVAELTAPGPRVQRPSFKTVEYLVQLIPALLDALQRALPLQQLNASIALLFRPEDLQPLMEATAGRAARAHFAGLELANDDGTVAEALDILGKTRTVECRSKAPSEIYLHLNPSRKPPIDPVIAQDARYLAEVVNLRPEIESTPEPKPTTAPPTPRKQAALKA